MKEIIDHVSTSEITCPYCGHVDTDSWEHNMENDGDSTMIDCQDCGKEFKMVFNLDVSYSTWKKPEDCKHRGYIFCDECGKRFETVEQAKIKGVTNSEQQ